MSYLSICNTVLPIRDKAADIIDSVKPVPIIIASYSSGKSSISFL